MHFSISKDTLCQSIQIVGHAISSNSPQASLRGILLTCKDNTLTLTGSDADISIQINLEPNEENNLNIYEEGKILIDNKYLNEISKKIDSDIINLEIIDGSLTKISGEKVVYKINGMFANDYPVIDFSKPENEFSVFAYQLTSIIEQTSFATAPKETRPVLTGVNFNLENNVLHCTATDSYRLAKKLMPLNYENNFNVTIPARSLSELKSTLIVDDEKRITVALNDKKAQFISDNIILQTRLLDGGYPDTNRLIPTEFSYVLHIERDYLIKAIDRQMFIKTDNLTINNLKCSEDEIILSNKSQEIGESNESLNGTFEGSPLDISFSGTYLMDALKALRGKDINIKFTGSMKPFILESVDDDTTIQLVLPVRTYN